VEEEKGGREEEGGERREGKERGERVDGRDQPLEGKGDNKEL